MKKQGTALLLVSTLLLTACGPAIIGTAATGATMMHDRRTAGTIIDDYGTQLSASTLLREHPELKEDARIKVVSYDNNVLLIGQVPDQNRADEVERLVYTLPNIEKVYNELEIQEPKSIKARSSDTWLTTRIKAISMGDKELDPVRLKVVTENGVVYLMGLMTREEADVATNKIREVDGVKKVVRAFEYID